MEMEEHKSAPNEKRKTEIEETNETTPLLESSSSVGYSSKEDALDEKQSYSKNSNATAKPILTTSGKMHSWMWRWRWWIPPTSMVLF
jgi:hypothetical protein